VNYSLIPRCVVAVDVVVGGIQAGGARSIG
jgi:hypothetical protein